jgi:hypothetical protein
VLWLGVECCATNLAEDHAEKRDDTGPNLLFSDAAPIVAPFLDAPMPEGK